jgi:hypothetical protein
MANTTITIATSVYTSKGDAFVDVDPLGGLYIINTDAYVISTAAFPANGSTLGGGNWTVFIDGLSGTFADAASGLYLPGTGIETATVTIGAAAAVFGYGAASFGVYADRNLNLTNRGLIDATGRGVVAQFGSTSATIRNFGTIQGGEAAISFNGNGGTHTVDNTDTIFGGTWSILNSSLTGVETITNREARRDYRQDRDRWRQ